MPVVRKKKEEEEEEQKERLYKVTVRTSNKPNAATSANVSSHSFNFGCNAPKIINLIIKVFLIEHMSVSLLGFYEDKRFTWNFKETKTN